jgi:Mg2+/Co2+ transporter CorB
MDILSFIGLFFLLLIASLFSFLETASVAISEHKLISLADEEIWSSYALKLKQQLERVLIFSLFGNSFFNALVTTLSTMLVLKIFGAGHELVLSLSTLLVTLMIIIFSEAAPKIIASKAPVTVLRTVAVPLYFLFVVTQPLIWFIDKIVYFITRALGVGHADGTSLDELKAIIADKRSPFADDHRSILLNSIELEQLAIKEVVIPLRNAEIVNLSDDFQSIRDQLQHPHHTRILVCEGNLDQIIGFIHAKDILSLGLEEYNLNDLRGLIRKINFIPDFIPIIKQLTEAQKQRERIFVVVNEYGDTLGIACLEDMLEIVFGDFTTDAPHRSYLMIEESAGQYIVDGATLVREFNEAYNLDLPASYDAMSINGLIMKHLGVIPSPNFCFRINNLCFEVLNVGKYWAERVRISRILE